MKKSILPSTSPTTGYTQELRRRMTSMMSFSFCFTAVAVTTSVSGLFIQGILTGGPVVLIWSWIIGSFLTVLVCLNLAEISSTYPSTGSVYHWAGLLSSRENAPLASYITGWFNALGNIAADAFFGYAFAQSINDILTTFSYSISIPYQVAIGILATMLWAAQNFLIIEVQGTINNFASMWQVMTTATILLTLFIGASATNTISSADDIFFTYRNQTGFESVWYVVCIGILTSAYSFTGYEAGSHMAEETFNPKVNVPKGIIYTGLCTAITGFVYILGLLIVTASKVDRIIDEGWSLTDIFLNVSGAWGGRTLSIILAINIYFSGMSSLTVTSRQLYSMARDGCFPGSKYFKMVTKSTGIPVGGVLLTFVLDALLILLNLFSPTAFVAVTSIATIGYQISYAIPIYLRITGYGKKEFKQSLFHLGGYSIVIGWISLIWLVFTSILFLLPTTYPITIDTLSWSPIIVGGTVIVMSVYWFLSARHWFVGPARVEFD